MNVYLITEYLHTESITNHFGICENVYENFEDAKVKAEEMFALALKVCTEIYFYKDMTPVDLAKSCKILRGEGNYEYRISIIQREVK